MGSLSSPVTGLRPEFQPAFVIFIVHITLSHFTLLSPSFSIYKWEEECLLVKAIGYHVVYAK